MTQTDGPAVILQALSEVRRAVGTLEKTGRNEHFGYSYVSELDVTTHIQPLFDKAGLHLIPSVAGTLEGFDAPTVADKMTQYVAKFTLCHDSGAIWPDPLFVVAQGYDSSDKGAYKASTGAYKYCLLRLLMIATGDDPERSVNQADLDDELDADKWTGYQPATQPAPQPSSKPAPQPVTPAEYQGDPPEVPVEEFVKPPKQYWAKCFKASEQAYGKNNLNDNNKWDASKWALAQCGIASQNHIPKRRMREVMEAMSQFPSYVTAGNEFTDDIGAF